MSASAVAVANRMMPGLIGRALGRVVRQAQLDSPRAWPSLLNDTEVIELINMITTRSHAVDAYHRNPGEAEMVALTMASDAQAQFTAALEGRCDDAGAH